MRSERILLAAVFFAAAAVPAGAEYESKGKRDPFVPLILSDGRRINPPGVEEGTGSAGLNPWVLQGIVYDPAGDSYAILNGHILRENQESEGIKVLKIENNSVTLLSDGESHRLTLQRPGNGKETE